MYIGPWRAGPFSSLAWRSAILAAVTEGIETIASLISVDSKYIAILLKVTGIAYICEFTAKSVQRTAGYSSVASQIELGREIKVFL